MLTDDQKAEREGKLGSSDAAVVAGLSSYKSPLQLYHELRGDVPRYTKEDTRAQQMGSRLEPVIAEMAAEDMRVPIVRMPTVTSQAYPWMVANVDFVITEDPRGPGIMEVKNRGAEKPWDEIPHDIMLQVEHQFICTGYAWGVVAVLFEYGNLVTYPVSPDQSVQSSLIELESRFMDGVERGIAPQAVWTAANVDFLKRLYPKDAGTAIEITDVRAPAVAYNFCRARQALKQAEELKTEAEGHLKSWMQDASTATIEGFKLSWKATKGSRRFDEEKFAEENPALYAMYQNDVPGHRVFRVTPGKEIVL